MARTKKAKGGAGYAENYRRSLFDDVLPFWLDHAVDREQGGFITCLNRDGTIIDTDKGMWQQGRFTWLLATLYNTVEKRQQWLDLARHGIDFLDRYGFDSDGRMFFQVSRSGDPIRKRRYLFSESFAAMAYAAYAKAVGSARYADKAAELFNLFIQYNTTPGLIPAKVNSANRPMKAMGFPMITIATAQVLRDTIEHPAADQWIDRAIAEIQRDFLNHEYQAVLEVVGPQGQFIDHFDGRTLNPGHAIEGAWFILHEAKIRNKDQDLIALGRTMLDWMWRIGWDAEHGGLFYFRDVKGWPAQEYWHDMKFWWPHCEAIIATLLAHHLTKDDKYKAWHKLVHDYTFGHFPDREYGEWFGYLHRDGRLSVPLKGNLWKGPFHIPRMLLYCWQLLI
ncbi:AGE family epimerase/isomerase [candidate division KSB1 bacterium]|nr:AGE family epimerase/isomerase [candidate division KSB1 bacterium]RQW02471.1 MAG: N-acylglucosamine 2-epimerase [candidate division KSB1 bacterium]